MRGKGWIAEVQAGKWVVYVPPKQARCSLLLTTKPSPPRKITAVILPFRGGGRELFNSLASFTKIFQSHISTMALWESFSHIFSFNKKYSYDAKVADQITSNRKALDNQLFVDRLLSLAGIKGGKGIESSTDG